MEGSMLKIGDESKVHPGIVQTAQHKAPGWWPGLGAPGVGGGGQEVAPLLGLISCTWMQPDAGPGPPRTT